MAVLVRMDAGVQQEMVSIERIELDHIKHNDGPKADQAGFGPSAYNTVCSRYIRFYQPFTEPTSTPLTKCFCKNG